MILNNQFVLEILANINKGMFELHKFILNWNILISDKFY